MYPIEKKEKYLRAQKLLQELKRLIKKGDVRNEARIMECMEEVRGILYEIISVSQNSSVKEAVFGDKDVRMIDDIIKYYDPDRGSLKNYVERKLKYLKAQKLLEERKRLMEEGGNGNGARIEYCKDEAWTILHEIIFGPLRINIAEEVTFGDTCSTAEEVAFGNTDMDMIGHVITVYDPEKGPLENYVNFVWTRRRNFTREGIDIGSINMTAGEDDDTEIIEIIESSSEEGRPGGLGPIDDAFEHLIGIMNAINQMCLNKSSKKNNNLRLIFTDIMTDICKNGIDDMDIPCILSQQKSILSGMDMEFLDFYMSALCRSLIAIHNTDLKKWEDIPRGDEVIRKEHLIESPELPLSNKVYVCFMWSMGTGGTRGSLESSISQCRTSYAVLLKKLGLERFIAKAKHYWEDHGMSMEWDKSIFTASPLLDISLAYLGRVGYQEWGDPASVKNLYIEIDTMVTDACRTIQDFFQGFQGLKDKETALIETKKENITRSYINDFIKEWQYDFDGKFQSIRNKKVEKRVPDHIRDMALSEIRKNNITQDEDHIRMILRSLDHDLAERVQPGGSVICSVIGPRAVSAARNEIKMEIVEETSIDQRIVSDILRAVRQSDSNRPEKIAAKVQDDNLYRYYWM